ncbi:MAG: ABC transporter permease [Gemmatimonadetes bacterium]|nr:ABC transporter permease [Gemmatimonadota bacterium]
MTPRDRGYADFDEEIRAHIELEADRLVERGLGREEALAAARASFGSMVKSRKRFEASERWGWLDRWGAGARGDGAAVVSREAWWRRLWDGASADIALGLRALRRDRSLVLFVTLVMGLGIGASATVFSTVQAVLLRPPPFEDPNRLVFLFNGERGGGERLSQISVQIAHLQDLRREGRAFEDVAGLYLFDRPGSQTLTGDGEPERLTRLRVTQNFFPLLGVRPVVGRTFDPSEAVDGGPNVVMLSHALWRSRFGADPDVVGRAITIDDRPATVIGVLPASFRFATILAPTADIDFVVPLPLNERMNRQGNTLALIGRLRPDATVETAQAEASLIASRAPADGRNSFDPLVRPLHEQISDASRDSTLLLAAAVGLVMLIVCANLSNLLLSRGAARERELAIRAAAGASRPRLIRQMLSESLALALCGGVVGLSLAFLGARYLANLDANIPMLAYARVDVVVLAFTVGATVLTGVVVGVLPAVRLSGLSPEGVLREGSRGSSGGRRRRWLRKTLVVSEVALACLALFLPPGKQVNAWHLSRNSSMRARRR